MSTVILGFLVSWCMESVRFLGYGTYYDIKQVLTAFTAGGETWGAGGAGFDVAQRSKSFLKHGMS